MPLVPRRVGQLLTRAARQVSQLAARVVKPAGPVGQRRPVVIGLACAAVLTAGATMAAWGFNDGAAAGGHAPGIGAGVAVTGSDGADVGAPYSSTKHGKATQPGVAAPAESTSASPEPSASVSPSTGISPSVSASAVPSSSPKTNSGPDGTAILTGSKAVALTFDDGPDPTLTPQILDLLKQHNVKATFCVIGSRARDYPDLIKRIAAEGHTFCNHSWQHLLDLGKRDASYLQWDLKSTNDAILASVPDAKIAYFRAPGGNYTHAMIDTATALGMHSIYWDVDPRDWDNATYGKGAAMSDHVIGAVEKATRPGSIVLSHDRGHPDTVTAYATLLPWLKDRFELIPLPIATN